MQYPILDAVISAMLVTAPAATSVLIETAPTSQRAEIQLLLLPLIGSMFVGGAAIMLNPQPETRRIVIGRSALALFCGVVIPQALGLFHPALAELSVKPSILLLSGGMFSGLTYILSLPFFRQAYARADGVAKREADRIEAKYSPPAPPAPVAPAVVTVNFTNTADHQ